MGDKLHHFMKKKIKDFISMYGIITISKLNYARKAIEKKKWTGLKDLICINFKCL